MFILTVFVPLNVCLFMLMFQTTSLCIETFPFCYFVLMSLEQYDYNTVSNNKQHFTGL